MADSKAAVDLASGTAAGVTQLLVGHPFDSIKVVMQTSTSGQPSMMAAVRQIVAGGPLEVYKGMGAPMVTVAAFNAVLFSSWGAAERLILGADVGNRQMTAGEAATAGAIAGVPVSLLASPTELIKCRLQQQAGQVVPANAVYTAADYQAGKMLYRGPADVLRATLKYEGVLAVMRGLTPTLMREVPGNFCYFGAYSMVKQAMATSKGLASPSELDAGSLMLAGGIGGAAFWVFVYPVDVIKTKIQTQNSFKPAYSGVADAARKIMAAEGMAGLYRGFTPCLARAFPANSVAFLTYERVKQMLEH